jgi:LysR family hydrogen peroxide-inducible transcriptional activator
MISIQQMQYILILSEELHFQRASERCFVTQPTLSMQIKKAEELLGAVIFDRSVNPIKLTAFGLEVLEVIREILTENERLKVIKSRYKGEYKEEIRLGVIPTVSAYLIPKMFSIWKKSMGEINLTIEELTTNSLLEALEKNEIDVAIFAGPHAANKYRTVPLFTEEILIYCPSLKKKEVSMDVLQQQNPWLLSKGNCLRTQMIEFCQLTDSHLFGQWNYQGGNLKLLMEMVDNEGGYTLIPENLPISEKRKKAMVQLTSKFGSPAREIIAVFPSRTIKSNGIDRIIRDVQLNYMSSGKSKKINVLGWK